VRERLVRILAGLDRTSERSTEELIETIEVMTMHERYYTPDQLATLQEHARELGPEGMEQAQADWADVIAAAGAERQRGTDPADERLRMIVERWQGLIAQFTGGDPGIFRSLKTMYEQEGVETASRGVVSSELMAYVGEAIRAHGSVEAG
jgi:hypothetical protein